MISYKFRIYPSREQKAMLNQHMYTSKALWNELLAMTKDSYANFGHFTTEKAMRECVKNSGIYSQVGQSLVARLQRAIDQKFKLEKKGIKRGFPRFKKRIDSLIYPQAGFSLGSTLKVTPFGEIAIKKHRELKGSIKTLTLKCEPSGKWYAVFVTDHTPKRPQAPDKEIGIDFNLENFATLSNGERIENPRFLKVREERLAMLQRQLSKKKKGSKNRRKAARKVAIMHEKVRNSRTDFHHKLSRRLADNYRTIAVEDLRIDIMSKGLFAKSFHDVGVSSFLEKLCYKVESTGGIVVKVDPRNTTQECSCCGTIVKKSLSQRMHNCPYCGVSLSRDHNAAINILKRATAGLAGSNACGVVAMATTLKQEAHHL